MIQLIYGEDVVSAEEALAEITRNTGPEDLRDINYTSFLAQDLSPEQLNAAVFAMPFMSDFRVVVVKGLLTTFERRGRASSGAAQRNRNPLGQWADLPDALVSLPPTTNLTFVDGSLSRSNPMLRRLAPLSDAREFPLPRERDMPGWIMGRAKTIGVDIEPRASATLAEAIGRQPRLIDTELRKLALYADGRAVRDDDVRMMVAYVREANIFQAVDAVIGGRAGVALSLITRIMDDGSPAAYILSMLSRQARLLIMAKDMMARGAARDDIGRRLRLSGWVLNKTLQQERRMTQEYLAYFHHRLVETDLTLKTKPIAEHLAIEMLVADLTINRA